MSGGRRTPPLPAGEENGGGRRQEQIVGGESSRRRAGEPSSSRPRSADLIWPEHFVEAVAVRIAEDAALVGRRLDAAPAVVTFFQVCSAWRAISFSELLWQDLTRRVWSPRHRRRRLPSWREEFISLHRTGANFRAGRCFHNHIHPPISPALSCRRLAFSDRYLATGFSDGSVRLYNLPIAALLAVYDLHIHRDRLGHFSTSISGIILLRRQLVFASQDGDIGVAAIADDNNNNNNFVNAVARRARAGNPVENGTLVDFAGDGRWWVGIFAGAPGWSWRVWDGETEQQVYAGGSLTDRDSVAGWHMLADISGPSVARVGVAESGLVIGCTSSRVQAVSVEGGGEVEVIAEMEVRRAAAADALGASDGRVVVVDGGRVATVMVGRNLEEVCRFGVVGRRRAEEAAARGREVIGCMNWGFVIMWVGGGGGRVWDAATGDLLYGFRQRVGEVRAAAASDRYVAAWAEDSGLHLWDFGAGL